MTQPDSPEDLLHEIYCLYEKDKYAETLAKQVSEPIIKEIKAMKIGSTK